MQVPNYDLSVTHLIALLLHPLTNFTFVQSELTCMSALN